MAQPVSVPIEHNRPGRPGKNFAPRYLDIVAIVDASDAERILARRWTLHKARSGPYVKEVGHGGDFLHRVVLELPSLRDSGLVVDHKNHDRLDNRRENLRAVPNVLNLANSGANRTAVYSLFKGVSFDRRRGTWIAQIGVNGKHRHLGRYDTEQQAALAYNLAAFEAWGEHAQLNDVDSDVTLPAKRATTSAYWGVCWIARHKRFRASIRVDGKQRHLGEFVSEEDAALAYNKAALEIRGEHARLNIIRPAGGHHGDPG